MITSFSLLHGQSDNHNTLMQYSFDAINEYFNQDKIYHDTVFIVSDTSVGNLEYKLNQKIIYLTVSEFKQKYSRDTIPVSCQIYIPTIKLKESTSIKIKFSSSNLNMDGTMVVNFAIVNNSIAIIDHHFYIWYSDND